MGKYTEIEPAELDARYAAYDDYMDYLEQEHEIKQDLKELREGYKERDDA